MNKKINTLQLLSGVSVFINASLLFETCFFIFVGPNISDHLNVFFLANGLLFVPFSFVSIPLLGILLGWSLKRKEFYIVTKIAIALAVSIVLSWIIFGFLFMGYAG